MKTQLISRFYGSLLSLLMICNAFAQKTGDKTLAFVRLSDGSSISENSGNFRFIGSENVNTKVLNAFSKSFEPVSNLNWSKVGKDFLAIFTVNGKETRALFTKKGNLVYTISYGQEKDLPAENRRLVKSNYIDYTITSAIEVKEDNRNIWVIKLEDATNIIFVRIENGEMEEMMHYQKAK